jgi:hypothetical protein
VLARLVAERREPVERYPAANRVETGLRMGQRRRAVRDVSHRAWKSRGDFRESLELPAYEAFVGLVGGGEMGHHSRDADGVDPESLVGRHAESAHARVHFHVH